jgi:hypothetical protein
MMVMLVLLTLAAVFKAVSMRNEFAVITTPVPSTVVINPLDVPSNLSLAMTLICVPLTLAIIIEVA